MNSNRSLTISNHNQQNNENDHRRQGKYTAILTFCRVCNDKARYFHYGALVCASCKTFFRRYACYSKDSLRCHFKDNCEITKYTRTNCAACRFNKCLVVGMSSNLIRKEDFSGMYVPKSKTSSSLIVRVPQIPTLNLLSTDRSLLSTSNWTTLSNVIHAFDRFIPITQTRNTIDQLSSHSIDINHILSMFGTFYSSTELFIGSSADFQILTFDEKTSLYQRNLHGVLHLCATFIYQLSGMFQSSASDQIIISIYGYEIFQQTKRIVVQLDYDITITKLLLFILAFSSNCYMVNIPENINDDIFLHGTFRLFGSQNVYVEILWKYLIYRYDYYDAALRFARLIKHVLDLMIMNENAEKNSQVHHDFIDEVTVLTEQTLVIKENEAVPLWGKT